MKCYKCTKPHMRTGDYIFLYFPIPVGHDDSDFTKQNIKFAMLMNKILDSQIKRVLNFYSLIYTK